MNSAAPASINEYLQALRLALQAADPALVQDALYDAEQHLRAEIAANPNLAESVVLANICLLYTSPSPRDGLLSRMPSSA